VRLLLDTHIVLWWLADSPRLAKRSKTLIARNAEVFVSAATAWEIAIKRRLGKLQAPDDLEAALAASRFQELAISVRHAVAAGGLSGHHDDPFDRLLVAQAQAESLTLVTSDERLQAYGIQVMLNAD
jgi:PIN domain nuclease of toxin-antitoxin system